MIIDTHTHFYDPTRPQGVPWPGPEEKPLYRTVLPEHFRAVAAPEGVTRTVVVEASAWVEDNQWILDLAAKEPCIAGFVGNLRPGKEGFAANLDRFAANPLFRGIRIGVTGLQDMDSEPFLADVAQLAAKGLELDVLIRDRPLRDLVPLARRLPGLPIVVNHIAEVPIDGKAPDVGWAAQIREVAACPNVHCKVSALVERTPLRPAPDDVDYYRPTLDVLWDAFGEDRLIYGSNWPVSEPFAPYSATVKIVREYFAGKGPRAAGKYFSGNARAVYKWVAR